MVHPNWPVSTPQKLSPGYPQSIPNVITRVPRKWARSDPLGSPNVTPEYPKSHPQDNHKVTHRAPPKSPQCSTKVTSRPQACTESEPEICPVIHPSIHWAQTRTEPNIYLVELLCLLGQGLTNQLCPQTKFLLTFVRNGLPSLTACKMTSISPKAIMPVPSARYRHGLQLSFS